MSSPPNPFGPNAPGSGNPYQAPGGTGAQFGPPPQQSPALAIASLVCGILGILMSCCCGLFAIPLPLLAIGLGVFAMMKPDGAGKGMAIGGIICGAVAILMVVVLFVVALSNPELLQQLQQMQNR